MTTYTGLPLGNEETEVQDFVADRAMSKTEWRKKSIKAAIGREPILSEASTEGQIANAFNWYSYECEASDAKKYVLAYLKKAFRGGDVLADRLDELSDWEFGATGWMSRQLTLGNSLPADYLVRLNDRLKTLNDKAKKILAKEVTVVRPVVQRLFTPAASAIIAELDERIDHLKKATVDLDLYKMISERSPSPAVLGSIVGYFTPFLSELHEAVKKKNGDEQVLEAYSKISKPRIKLLTEFVSKIIQTCSQISTNKKHERKPRAKKVKTALQATKFIKYKLSDDTYNIKSIQPTDLVGSLQLWVFNTKTRKLGVYHASDSRALSIKGTTIIGFNEVSSVQKKLRKPEATLLNIASGTKVSLRHVMENIKAKSSILNGRINADVLLLRSVK